MKKIIILIIIIAIILAYGWLSLAKPIEASIPEAEVLSLSGQVELTRDGQSSSLTKGDKLQSGDVVTTGPESQIEINFFDNAVSRLGADTSVTLEKIYQDADNNSQTNISLKVSLGKVWSRIVQLADQEASFSVGSDQTVAAVRGTVVNFEVNEKGEDLIQTVDDVVEVYLTRQNDKKINLIQNRELKISSSSLEGFDSLEPKFLDQNIKKQDWWQNNLTKDEDFSNYVQNKRLTTLKEQVGALPGSPMYNAKISAEEAKISFSTDPAIKQKLQLNFIIKRLGEITILTSQGKVAKAEDILDKVQNKINKFLDSLIEDEAGSKIARNKIRAVLVANKNVLQNINPGDPGYNLKIKLDGINLQITAPEKRDFWTFKQREQIIKDLKRLKNTDQKAFLKYWQENRGQIGHLDDLKLNSDLVERFRILVSLLLDEGEGGASQLRDGSIREMIQDSISPSSGSSAGSSSGGGGTDADNPADISSEPESMINAPIPELVIENNNPATPSGGGAEPDVPVEPSSFYIIATGLNMPASGEMQMHAILEYSDGSTEDVTNQSEWALSGDLGTIDQTGLLQSDRDGGKGTVSAFYGNNDGQWDASYGVITALMMTP